MLQPSRALYRRLSIPYLNPQESRQLLDSLTSSFRAQLDKEHAGYPSGTTQGSSTIETDRNGHRQPRSSHGTNADRHFQAILGNSLFKHTWKVDESLPGAKDPMTVFSQAVTLGRMNLKAAEACLRAKKIQIVSSSAAYTMYPSVKNLPGQQSVRKSMKESQFGRHVLQWLIASGITNEDLYQNHPALTQLLMEYLVADGMQQIIWVWLEECYAMLTRFPEVMNQKLKTPGVVFQGILRRLIEAEASGCQSLDPAVSCLLRASDYVKEDLKSKLGPVSQYLARLIFIRSQGQLQMSSKNFNSFVEVYRSTVEKPDYGLAFLMLLHPSQPESKRALGLLKSPEGIPSYAHKLLGSKPILTLGLKTAQLLQEHHHMHDASWVINFLQEKFPKELGLQHEEKPHQMHQVASLLYLEGLSPG